MDEFQQKSSFLPTSLGTRHGAEHFTCCISFHHWKLPGECVLLSSIFIWRNWDSERLMALWSKWISFDPWDPQGGEAGPARVSCREILSWCNKELPTRAASGEIGWLGREGFPVFWRCAHRVKDQRILAPDGEGRGHRGQLYQRFPKIISGNTWKVTFLTKRKKLFCQLFFTFWFWPEVLSLELVQLAPFYHLLVPFLTGENKPQAQSSGASGRTY